MTLGYLRSSPNVELFMCQTKCKSVWTKILLVNIRFGAWKVRRLNCASEFLYSCNYSRPAHHGHFLNKVVCNYTGDYRKSRVVIGQKFVIFLYNHQQVNITVKAVADPRGGFRGLKPPLGLQNNVGILGHILYVYIITLTCIFFLL